jgi:hypothetical protein
MQKERIIDCGSLLNNKYKMKNEYLSSVSLSEFIQGYFSINVSVKKYVNLLIIKITNAKTI